MKFQKILAALFAGAVMAGCTVDADDDPTVVTPGNKTVIEGDAPDVHVDAPKVDVKTTPPGGASGGSTVTTG